ncbi:MAG: dTDP-4-dehydrorhamnose 3,5-epimerase [Firmicutes bacterium ADurb.Bin300]|jgi:dTDP-4-dehydrorhamnose 3,5-epimerase|nr:MAG: dTDP-4-dehydrorhamnose 3,5-epimerase [Firmicutes bacterium ADurb.Bin300]
MQSFKFEKLQFDGLYLISPFLAEDNRGYFLKNYEKEVFEKAGIDTDVFEAFESLSVKGVVRGLHFQTDNPQSKIVRCITGRIYDVVVDIRKDSPTFGKWAGVYLDDVSKQSVFIPKGFAHGFITLSDNAISSYICSGKYSKGTDTGVVWNDSDIGIDWPMEGIDNIIISERDSQLQSFKAYCGE